MEDLYGILNCTEKASVTELRKSYLELSKIYHPDKCEQSKCSNTNYKETEPNLSTASSKFVQINRAWKILSDTNLRSQYDIRWKQRCLAQDWPIHDTVSIDDFDVCPNEDFYTLECKCGGSYFLSESDTKFSFDIVCCDTCSLSIRVIYDK